VGSGRRGLFASTLIIFPYGAVIDLALVWFGLEWEWKGNDPGLTSTASSKVHGSIATAYSWLSSFRFNIILDMACLLLHNDCVLGKHVLVHIGL
jgi:hypothetical protein